MVGAAMSIFISIAAYRDPELMPTIRQAGMKPALTRWNIPGHSFRRDRSPVAPTRTTTCGYRGPTFEAFFAMWPPRGFVERLARPPAPADCRAIALANCTDTPAQPYNEPLARRCA